MSVVQTISGKWRQSLQYIQKPRSVFLLANFRTFCDFISNDSCKSWSFTVRMYSERNVASLEPYLASWSCFLFCIAELFCWRLLTCSVIILYSTAIFFSCNNVLYTGLSCGLKHWTVLCKCPIYTRVVRINYTVSPKLPPVGLVNCIKWSII